MSSNSLPPKRQAQRGATMIEVLVTVLILSFGLLGMAGLQVRALRGNQSAIQKSQAVMLSYYIIEAMRVDVSAAKGLSYNTGALDSDGNIDNAICTVAAVTGSTLVANNQRAWITALKTNLGTVDDTTSCGAVVCNADGQCTVQVKWDDTPAGGLGAQTITTSTRI